MPDGGLTCREVVELVDAYLDCALGPRERERVARHLDRCPHCQEFLAQMNTTVSAIRRLAETGLDPAVSDEFVRAFRDWHREEGAGA